MTLCVQAVDAVEDIDTLQATLSPVDGLCLTELTRSSVEELLLNDLSPAESTCSLADLPDSPKHPATNEIAMSSYVDSLLMTNPALSLQDDLQSLLHATKLSSDVMLSDDRHSLLLPEASSVDLLDTLQLVAGQQSPTSDLYADDFVLDDADWSSVQVCIIKNVKSSIIMQYMKYYDSCRKTDVII